MRGPRHIALPMILALLVAACGGATSQQPQATPTAEATAPTQAAQPAATTAPAYPTRAIEIWTGFGPGGTTDLVARMTADYLGTKWGVPINVVNKPGGNTVPANVELYAAAPDGYTVFSDAIGSSALLPLQLGSSLTFDVLERTFVAMISSNSMLLMTAPDSQFTTLKDVVDEAKRDPENFTWTAVGVAEIPMRQLLKEAGVDIAKTKPVQQGGSLDAITLASQGSVKLAIAAVGPSLSPLSAGLIRPLAIAADKRWPALPDVPTAAEAGFKTVRIISWIGITAPPNLPQHVLDKWNEGIQEMLGDPEIQERIAGFASVPDYRGPEEFKEEVAGQIQGFASLYAQ